MVRRSVFHRAVAAIALAGSGSIAQAAVIPAVPGAGVASGTATSSLFQTGDVEKDMPSSNTQGVTVVKGQQLGDVYQPKWMTDAGLTNGYVMKDIRLSYDAKSDTLAVGVNFYGIAGNTDGSADGSTNPQTTAMGGSNPAHIGGDKSIAIGFAPVTSLGDKATPVVVAGVPAVKTGSPAGSLDGFNVATVNQQALASSGIARAFGTTLTGNLGTLAYDPSSAHPDFEFTIKNFSKIPGLNALSNGFYIQAYAGTGSTIIVGKSFIPNTLVSVQKQPQNINDTPGTVAPPKPLGTPEPTTVLAWGLVVGGLGWQARRRARGVPRS